MRWSAHAILENAAIILGIIALWPYILGYSGGWFLGGAVVALVLLVIVAVIRLRRFRRAIDELHGSDKKE